MTDRLRYTPEQIRAESQWTPAPPKRCDVCSMKLRQCGCAKPYVGKRNEEYLLPDAGWMK